MGDFKEAMKKIEADKGIIAENKEYYKSIFKNSIEDYCQKFNIKLP